MKTSRTCPKCGYHRLYVIEHVAQPDPESSNQILPFWLVAAPMSRTETGTDEGTRYRSHAGHMEAWVCAACGFTEWYANDLGELELLAHQWSGVRVVESPHRGAR